MSSSPIVIETMCLIGLDLHVKSNETFKGARREFTFFSLCHTQTHTDLSNMINTVCVVALFSNTNLIVCYIYSKGYILHTGIEKHMTFMKLD